ncbi:hypothetical protein NHX12_003151 [Muraenolepis orangiensis]|uniref:SAM domain-containing protein n=1 Tax=Muraenolepis orangiensis TaxID=630683 RepID=A0A9Q0E070_9TELE|nr:hypothetical protein NHX12_003151 [Muraenolepis orangiensis]
MMSDASDMLAAALEQMDGIIAGSKALDYSNGMFDCQSPTSPFMGSLRALHLLEDLRSMLELMDPEEREGLRCQIPDSTADSLVEWLQGHLSNGHISLSGGDHYQERLTRLESDKESLVLQVSVLTDQVDAQGEKIRDLDVCLDDHRDQLNSTEDLLQQELLDSEDLILQINELRYRLVEMESDKLQYEKKLRSTKSLMAKLSSLKIKMGQMHYEKQRKELSIQAMEEELAAVRRQQGGGDGEMRRLEEELAFRAQDRDVEVQRMKMAVESLMAANEEKDRKIEELKQSVQRYKKVQDMVLMESLFGSSEAPLTPVGSTETSPYDPEAPEPLSTAPESNEDNSKSLNQDDQDSITSFFKLRGGKRTTSTPNLAETERRGTEHLDLAGLPQRSSNSDSTQTLPTSPDEGKKKAKGIKKLFGKLRRSQSTTFNVEEDLSEGDFRRGGVRSTAGPRLGWSRDLQHTNNDLDAPFVRWSKDKVCEWLKDQGLGLYGPMARVWITSGQTLLQASQQDLERELGIKHPLHRKKLQLALQALGSEEEDNKGKLDYNWVTRWLDDIGLPQYKTQFDEGRVDGRMLHYMTVDDVLSLKVGSVLHHLSIKRAVQVLRLNSYQPNCLRRRPSDEVGLTASPPHLLTSTHSESSHSNNISPAEVSQWTNHRVMEWLRSVDLAEYAPNLRGSGVHGGLMVLEPRFNVETMALLLNIPPNKTLLRRHLATHFNVLVGLESQQLKQESLENPDYVLLTATAKVKMPKGRSFQKGYGGELQIYEDDLDRLEQMEDSEGTVRQIGAFSEEIQNLTSMLKDDEFFKESSHSPDPSVTDEESNA